MSFRHRLLGIVAIRPGEVLRSVLCFCYLFLIIAAYLLIKAVRSALFISEFGAIKLPYVMLGIAVLVGLFASFYIRLARRMDSSRLVSRTLIFFASNVALFWWLSLQGHAWLYPVIYVWAGIFGVVATMQVWTLANDLFTTREAKRVFGFVGAGGNLGAIAGGSTAARLAPVIGTRHLLLIVTAVLLLAAITVTILSRHRTARRSASEEVAPPGNLSQSLRAIGDSKHLRLMAGLVFITALATTTVDFQFGLVAEGVAQDDRLTAFFGTVYTGVGAFAFLLQLLGTSRLLRYFGVGFSILLLPVTLIGATFALMMTQSVAAAVLLKGADGTFKHSVDRSCRELMYLPLPSTIKVQAKSTIDTVMDRMGDGFAGVLLIVVTAGLGWRLVGSLAFNVVVIALWIVTAFRVRMHYVHELRSALGRVAFRAPALVLGDSEADTRRVVEEALREGTEEQKLNVLAWMAQEPGLVGEDALYPLLGEREAPVVRRAALAVVLGGQPSDLPAELVSAVEGEGHQALISVIEFLVEGDRREPGDRLHAFLDGLGETARLPVVAFLVRRLGTEFEPFARRVFEALTAPDAAGETRRAAARTLALLPADSPIQSLLEPLLRDRDPAVASAAAASAATLGRLDLLPAVIDLLDRPGARIGARRSVLRFGSGAVDTLAEALEDPKRSPAVRRQLPSLLAGLGSTRAIAALGRRVEAGDPVTLDRCLAHLHRMRWWRPGIRPIRRARLVERVLEACGDYRLLSSTSRALDHDVEAAGPSVQCLMAALDEARRGALDRVFKLLGLEWSVADMDRAHRSLGDDSPVGRSNALELLDNILPRSIKQPLVPLMEAILLPGQDATAPPSRQEALRLLVEGPDPVVAAHALNVARVEGMTGLSGAAERASSSDVVPLREEAEAFLEQHVKESRP